MGRDTETNRDAALNALVVNGMTWERVGRGQRFVVHIDNQGQLTRALVKVASVGSAMIRADIDDADRAQISGFGPDVDHVLFAVGDPDRAGVDAYLVPIEEVEDAYRSTHRAWRARKPDGKENLTWVIWFNDRGDRDCNGFHRTWEKYRISAPRPLQTAQSSVREARVGLTVEEAKAGIAASHGVSPDQVKIVVEY